MKLNNIEIIFYLVCNLFRIYTISLFFSDFFGTTTINSKYKIRPILYFLYYLINSMSFIYLMWSPNLIILTNIFFLFTIVKTYSGKWKYHIFSVIAILTINTICEDLCYYLLISFNIKHVLTIGIISTNFIFFLLNVIFHKYVDFKNNIEISAIEWIATISIPIFCLFISIIVIDKCNDEIAIMIGELCLILVMMLMFYLLNCLQIMYQERLDVNLLKQQTQAYENQILLLKESEKKLSSFRHDIKNHYITLTHLAKQDNSTEVIQYLEDLLPDIEDHSIFSRTGNYIIDSFLNMKLAKASKLGAKIITKLEISNEPRIELKDISIILGNLLDNSITAIEKCDKKKYIEIRMRELPGALHIEIKNSFKNIILKNNNKFITTKKDYNIHGFGLRNVSNVVNKYQGDMQIDFKNEIFTVNIILFI